MASGGHVDRIAAEFGVHFVDHTIKPRGRHESRARRTCQTILKKHGPEHLRLVFGLINTTKNRGNWQAACFTAVSRLVLNKPDLLKRADFLDLFDRIDLDALLKSAKQANASAPTVTTAVLLSYEVNRLIAEQEAKEAA
ncbi:hypothetical protein [Labrenzia sp. OB1]|uniref:hypothetical protein n=1 Tax=Labrenzia sp. OB1 TaxID=1561204 RepID=UPI000837AD8C|nr:hypothetical protein [Labrenzia sp. OB1]